MGMDSDTIDLFINNAVFSPQCQTWLVAALGKMQDKYRIVFESGVEGRLINIRRSC